MQPGGSGLASQALDRLADAIVSIEYYMETLQAGRADPWYMLDNAEAALDAVECRSPGRRAHRVATWPHPHCAHDRWSIAATSSRTRNAPRRCQRIAPVLAAPRSARPALAEAADPELIALFMEEAREEAGDASRATCPNGTRIPRRKTR